MFAFLARKFLDIMIFSQCCIKSLKQVQNWRETLEFNLISLIKLVFAWIYDWNTKNNLSEL